MTTVNIFLQTKSKLNALFSIKYASKKTLIKFTLCIKHPNE